MYKLADNVTEEMLVKDGFIKDLSGGVNYFKFVGTNCIAIQNDNSVTAWFKEDLPNLISKGMVVEC